MVWNDKTHLPAGSASVGGPATTNKDRTTQVAERQSVSLSLHVAAPDSDHRDDGSSSGSSAAAVVVTPSTPSAGRLQCGYERNCSTLYKHIEKEEWGGVNCFLETGYWTHGSLFPDRISPATQVKTWVCSNSKRTPWSVLPLHLALARGAPYKVVERLVELYPVSVQCKDFRDRFPIEIAVAHHCSNKIVDYLFCAHPEAVLCRWRDEGQESNLSRLDCQLLKHEVIRSHIHLLIEDTSDNKQATKGLSESHLHDSFLASGADGFGLLLEQVPNENRRVQYDGNECTLYKLMETRDWPRVDKVLLSEDITKQVSTWVYRQVKKSSWSILPLHAATAARAPYLTIGRLIEHCPGSVRCPDNQGVLPLHLAVRNGCCDEVVDLLFCAYPDAVFGKWSSNMKKKNASNNSHQILPIDFKVLRHDAIKSRVRSMLLEYSSDFLPVDLVPEARAALLAITAEEPPDVPSDKDSNCFQAVISRSLFEMDIPFSRQCNYDVNCTPLFKSMESADWSSIESFLTCGFWPTSLVPDACSPADQARTMVYRLDPDHPYNYCWSMLPIHHAIICDAPLVIVQLLVEVFPEAVRCTDHLDLFPLRLAMLHGADDLVVDFLFDVCPEALYIKAGGLTALEYALKDRDSVRACMMPALIDNFWA